MQPSLWLLLVPLVLAPLVHYLTKIRPSRRRARESAAMHARLALGDRVVTTGGLHGTVTGLAADTVDLEVCCPGKVHRYRRAAIDTVLPADYDTPTPTPTQTPGPAPAGFPGPSAADAEVRS